MPLTNTKVINEKIATTIANYFLNENSFLVPIDENMDNEISLATMRMKSSQEEERDKISRDFYDELSSFIQNELKRNKKIILEIKNNLPYGKLQEIILKNRIPINSFPKNLHITVLADKTVFVKKGKEVGFTL